MSKPTKFEDLKAEELYRAALEDFALPVEEADKNKKKILLAAFLEGGVEWADYIEQHPEVAPEPEVVVETHVVAPGLVGEHDTSIRTPEPTRAEKPVEYIDTATAPPIAVAAEPVFSPAQKYLIKMVRENPLYSVRGHKFTQTHPYALVDVDTAEYLLTKEDGFRQATPTELREFYG